MRRAIWAVLAFVGMAVAGADATAQSWVGGDSYALRVDKYDSFYGEARPIRWSVERPPGVYWKDMLAPKAVIHRRMYEASGGYPAVYYAAYPRNYLAGVPGGDPAYYYGGYPVGYPVEYWTRKADMETWRPPAIQIDPLPGDSNESEPYPAVERTPEELPLTPPPADPQGPPPSDGGALMQRPELRLTAPMSARLKR